ncbi:MAG: hypothetical protein ABR598_06485 [Candidatus Dormibacteria bacterium]
MVSVYVETGKKKVFASALDWPGWTRWGRDEGAALEALEVYRERYAAVPAAAGLQFPHGALEVVDRIPGGGTTDFGAPEFPASSDRRALPIEEAERMVALLQGAWAVLDAVFAIAPAELRKGPRGGGRDRDKMYDHVLEAEANYARTIHVRSAALHVGDDTAIRAHRGAVAKALRGAVGDPDPAVTRWLPRYVARRMAWHVLDHAWEMEDRSRPD